MFSFSPVTVNISTHILTKRMTKLEARINGSLAISTHILTKRMTTLWRSMWTLPAYFNSHPHEEDDKISEWSELRT